jgi:hypothetical protein
MSGAPNSQRTFTVLIAVTFVLLLSCVLGATWLFRTLELDARATAQVERAHYDDARKLARLVEVVGAYRTKRGALPASIDALRGADAREFFGAEPFDALFVDAWGNTFRLEAVGTGFRIFTLGRDDAPGGEGADLDVEAR